LVGGESGVDEGDDAALGGCVEVTEEVGAGVIGETRYDLDAGVDRGARPAIAHVDEVTEESVRGRLLGDAAPRLVIEQFEHGLSDLGAGITLGSLTSQPILVLIEQGSIARLAVTCEAAGGTGRAGNQVHKNDELVRSIFKLCNRCGVADQAGDGGKIPGMLALEVLYRAHGVETCQDVAQLGSAEGYAPSQQIIPDRGVDGAVRGAMAALAPAREVRAAAACALERNIGDAGDAARKSYSLALRFLPPNHLDECPVCAERTWRSKRRRLE
jgi:hypothetical protein